MMIIMSPPTDMAVVFPASPKNTSILYVISCVSLFEGRLIVASIMLSDTVADVSSTAVNVLSSGTDSHTVVLVIQRSCVTDGDTCVVGTDLVWSALIIVSVVGCGVMAVGFTVGLDSADWTFTVVGFTNVRLILLLCIVVISVGMVG